MFVADEYLQQWLGRIDAQHPIRYIQHLQWLSIGRTPIFVSRLRGERPLYIADTALALIVELIEEVL